MTPDCAGGDAAVLPVSDSASATIGAAMRLPSTYAKPLAMASSRTPPLDSASERAPDPRIDELDGRRHAHDPSGLLRTAIGGVDRRSLQHFALDEALVGLRGHHRPGLALLVPDVDRGIRHSRDHAAIAIGDQGNPATRQPRFLQKLGELRRRERKVDDIPHLPVTNDRNGNDHRRLPADRADEHVGHERLPAVDDVPHHGETRRRGLWQLGAERPARVEELSAGRIGQHGPAAKAFRDRGRFLVEMGQIAATIEVPRDAVSASTPALMSLTSRSSASASAREVSRMPRSSDDLSSRVWYHDPARRRRRIDGNDRRQGQQDQVRTQLHRSGYCTRWDDMTTRRIDRRHRPGTTCRSSSIRANVPSIARIVRLSDRPRGSARLLGFELGVVGLDEGADVVGQVEQLGPTALYRG